MSSADALVGETSGGAGAPELNAAQANARAATLEGRILVGATPSHQRILRELALLSESGQEAALVVGTREAVIYFDVPTAGAPFGLPPLTDVIVPVPDPYPPGVIDLAGLPAGSPILPRLRGGGNNQGAIQAAGQTWQLASYHPHNNGGGPPFDPQLHGFHTYFAEVVSWLAKID